MPKPVSLSLILTALSIVAWMSALLLPAANLGVVVAHGWEFLIHAWRAIGDLDIAGLSWLANPLLLGAWLTFFAFRTHRKLTMALAVCALFAALTSFLYNALNSAAGGIAVQSFEIGFYLWLASMLLQTAAAINDAACETYSR